MTGSDTTEAASEVGRPPGESRRLAEFIDADEKAMARWDKRFDYDEVTHESRGCVDARLPVIRVKNIASLSPAHKRSLDVGADRAGPALVLGGGLAQGRSSAYYEGFALDDFRHLVCGQVHEAASLGALCVSPYVPRHMLAGFVPSEGGDIVAVHSDDWWTLHLGELDPQAWVRAQSRRVRQTWNRDYRIAGDRGATFVPVEATSEALDRLVPLFHETMKHNGDALDLRMARWYLGRHLELPGAHHLCVTEEQGEPVGALLLRIEDSYCYAHAVGTKPDLPQWRDLYQVATFVAGMEFAKHHRFSAIGFGRSHGTPKVIRGCRPDPLFRVSYPKGGC